MQLFGLTVQSRVNPIGIGVATPLLSWKVISTTPGDSQTAYQVQCGSTLGGTDLWDSGKVTSTSQSVSYAGSTLASRKFVYWQIRAWDASGNPTSYSTGTFEIGLLTSGDWSGVSYIGHATQSDMTVSAPCPMFRKSFAVSKTVARARLYGTALGLFQARLNGSRVGQDELVPSWTNYTFYRLYQTYDVTSQIVAGSNAIQLTAADGTYCGNMSIDGNANNSANCRQYYGLRPYVAAVLYIDFTDGTTQTIPTDSSWSAGSGPILASDWYNGEVYDSRLAVDASIPSLSAPPGWTTPDTTSLSIQPSATDQPTIRRQQIRQARKITIPSSGNYIFDFGQNQAGRPLLTLRGLSAGITLTIRHAELLNSDGTLYTANLRAAQATDTYTTSGQPLEVWEPAFTYHGFRYAELSGYPGVPPADTVQQVTLHSDIPKVGHFKCSNQQLSQICQMFEKSVRSNTLWIWSDCCQRDERLGWNDDAIYASRAASYVVALDQFMPKWTIDQAISGFTITSPDVVGGGNIAGWTQGGVYLPYVLWKQYGLTYAMTSSYATMKNCVLVNAPSTPVYGDYGGDNGFPNLQGTDNNIFGPCYDYMTASWFSEMATALGHAADATAAQAKMATYLTSIQTHISAGVVGTGTQCNQAMALCFGLVPSGQVAQAVAHLVADITANGFQVGFHGLKWVFKALSDNGHASTAYSLLSSTSYPASFGAMIADGMTTLSEVWAPAYWAPFCAGEGRYLSNSMNHFSRGGGPAEWMVEYVAGIQPDWTVPGASHLIMAPQLGGGLTWAEAAWNGPYGLVSSSWTLNGTAFVWTIQLPPGVTASVTVPGASTTSVGSGTHSFSATYTG